MTREEDVDLVSVHGGHSGEFCHHAQDALEEIVRAYIDKGFAWFGITEHMPPADDRQIYPEEAAAGLDVAALYERFSSYMATCRRLQEQYADAIKVYVGFETEMYTGCKQYIGRLLQEFEPDYIVGSVHHVNDIPIDMSAEMYAKAIEVAGGIERLYCDYFDQQFELIDTFHPAVVGHFDLIRIFDQDYRRRLEEPEIRQRIRRNFARIKELGSILDFNLRALKKGADEPYISRSILVEAHELGLAVVPGDDSHGVESVGLYMEQGLEVLRQVGFDLHWRRPGD